MIDLPLLDSLVLGKDALAFLDRDCPYQYHYGREKCPNAGDDPSSTLIMRSCLHSRASSVDLPVLKTISTEKNSCSFFGPHHIVLEGCSSFQFSFTRFALDHFFRPIQSIW